MSIENIATRITQVQSMISALNGSPPPTSPASSSPPAGAPASFAQQLTQASASSLPANAAGGTALSGSSGKYDPMVQAAAAKYGINPSLLKGLIQQESGFDPKSTSGAGAVGLTQLMPGTAAALGVTDPSDPAQSVDAGAHYLRQQLDAFGGDIPKALAAYNAGPGAVQRYGGVPPYAETQDYVRKVQAYAAQFAAGSGPSGASGQSA